MLLSKIGSLLTRTIVLPSIGVIALVMTSARGFTQAPEPASIRFENVLAQSGLTFTLDQHATPEKNMVETMAGGVAGFDYDAHGPPGIYFTNGASIPSLRKENPGHRDRPF